MEIRPKTPIFVHPGRFRLAGPRRLGLFAHQRCPDQTALASKLFISNRSSFRYHVIQLMATRRLLGLNTTLTFSRSTVASPTPAARHSISDRSVSASERTGKRISEELANQRWRCACAIALPRFLSFAS